MKKILLNKFPVPQLCLLSAILISFNSCNKDLPDPTPIVPPGNSSTTSIGDLINNDTTFSIFKSAAAKYAAAAKVDLVAQLSDSNKVFTAFLPNNAAFRSSGFPNWDAVNSFLPLPSLAAILQYAIIPGQQFTVADVPATFPNIQLPTMVNIGVLPAPAPPIKVQLSTFLSKAGNFFYDNTVPVVQPDLKMKNGVVHLVGGIVVPPSAVLKDVIYSKPNLTYFKAAIARADSGQTGLNKLDSLLGYAATNMTILVPNDTAFQSIIFKLIYGNLLQQQVPPATAASIANGYVALPPDVLFSKTELFSSLTAATVRGIIAYHFLASQNPVNSKYEPNIRVFSINFSTTPTLYKTLVNAQVSIHPGIMAQATFAGPFVSDLRFTGLGTFPPDPTHPFSGPAAVAVSKDNLAVNGIFHVIDRVLLPQ